MMVLRHQNSARPVQLYDPDRCGAFMLSAIHDQVRLYDTFSNMTDASKLSRSDSKVTRLKLHCFITAEMQTIANQTRWLPVASAGLWNMADWALQCLMEAAPCAEAQTPTLL
jgi:hypothetical protein